jgi:hypothetical protein
MVVVGDHKLRLIGLSWTGSSTFQLMPCKICCALVLALLLQVVDTLSPFFLETCELPRYFPCQKDLWPRDFQLCTLW